MQPLEASFAHRLRRAATRVSRAQSEVLLPHGITLAEWSILHALYDLGAVAPSTLAETCGITRGAVTKLVDRLRAKRFLVRATAGGPDARYQTIALTGAGAILVPELAKLVAEAETKMFGNLSPDDRAALLKTFLDLDQVLLK